MLAVIAARLSSRRERVLRLCDQLMEQSDVEREKQHIAGVRTSILTDAPAPLPFSPRNHGIPPQPDHTLWLKSISDAYGKGKVRDEDLLLDPSYARLRSGFALADVLRVPRAFS